MFIRGANSKGSWNFDFPFQSVSYNDHSDFIPLYLCTEIISMKGFLKTKKLQQYLKTTVCALDQAFLLFCMP